MMSPVQMPLLQKLLKFGMVGASGLCLDFFITWIGKEKLRINRYIANATGFCVAVSSNFFLNYIWTFKGVSNNVAAAFGLFVSIAIVGLILNTGAIYLCNSLVKIEFYRSKVIAVGLVFLWNFGANYFITFHS